MVFYPQLVDNLRQNNESYKSKTLRQTYEVVTKMVSTSSNTLEGFEVHVFEGETRGHRILASSSEHFLSSL